jgi:hypothetical protein
MPLDDRNGLDDADEQGPKYSPGMMRVAASDDVRGVLVVA